MSVRIPEGGGGRGRRKRWEGGEGGKKKANDNFFALYLKSTSSLYRVKGGEEGGKNIRRKRKKEGEKGKGVPEGVFLSTSILQCFFAPGKR